MSQKITATAVFLAALAGCADRGVPAPAGGPPTPYPGLVGHSKTVVTVVAVPLSVAASLLPGELEPAPQTLTPAGTHPVLITQQRNYGVAAADGSSPPIDYAEAVLAVPLVQLRRGVDCVQGARGPFGFWPALALDSQWAVDVGRDHYAYDKHLAEVTATDTSFAVVYQGQTALSSTMGPAQPLTAQGYANVAEVAAAISTPILGKRPDGSLVWSAVTPTAIPSFSALTVDADLFGHRVSSPSINDSKVGSLLIDWPWVLSPPVTCPPQ